MNKQQIANMKIQKKVERLSFYLQRHERND